MGKRNLRLAMLLAIVVFFMQICIPLALQAERNGLAQSGTRATNDDSTHQALEKSLSLTEIDKEIVRLQDELLVLGGQLGASRTALAEQEKVVGVGRERAGKVLRAYYKGDRDFALPALFSAKSLPDLFRTMEYLSFIFRHDKRALDEYAGQYQNLKDHHEELTEQELALKEAENQLLAQRKRVLALENDIADLLDGSSDADRIRLLIAELTKHWEEQGIQKVHEYFAALSSAMGQLPSWLQQNRSFLQIKGLNYTVRISEEDLNRFLREQNEIFNNFSFTFVDGQIVASGSEDDTEVSLKGEYTVTDNAILFSVVDLQFNGFHLPDTTKRALEKQFDLGFYPHLIVPLVKPVSVTIADGTLEMKLRLSL